MLQEYLQQEGFDVSTVHSGERGAAEALSGFYSMVILDVMMPGASGIDVLRQIRQQSQMPVLMLTARGDDTDRIIGLELGADDYVPKPCTPRELAARIRAILRRIQTTAETLDLDQDLVVGDLVVLSSQRKVLWKNRTLELTGTEFNLLEILARHAGGVVTKEQLSMQALGRSWARFDRVIDVHMSSIRQKLGNLADGRSCIQTVYRKGYQLIKE